MSRSTLAFTIGIVLISTLSCGKNKEQEALAKAQKCLDEVPIGQYAKADDCLAMVADYSSQQAMILKCSIVHVSGGLMEDKVLKAYNALKDGSGQTNKSAAFMAALALDQPDINTGYTKALLADSYCQQTGVSGLKYLSGVIVAGTFMNKVAGSIDITDPNAAQTAITNLVNQCVSSPAASCTSDLPTLGTAVTNLAQSYCAGSSADQNVCSQVNDAVASAGGDSTNVGKALLCYMNHQTFSLSDGLCH